MTKLLALEFAPTAADSLGSAVEDLPLIEGLRALSLLPSKEVAALIAGAGIRRAKALTKTQPARASRLLAETARLVLASGDTKRAWGLTLRSNELRGKQASSAKELWRNFPVQYQVQKREHGQASADRLAAAMVEMVPLGSGSFGDAELESDVYLSLSESAGARQQFERAAEWWRKSREAVYGKGRRGVVPMSFFQEAIARSTRLSQAADRRAMIEAWRHDPGSARRDYEETYRPLLKKTLALVRDTTLSDVRAQVLVMGPMPWSLNTIQQLLGETEALYRSNRPSTACSSGPSPAGRSRSSARIPRGAGAGATSS